MITRNLLPIGVAVCESFFSWDLLTSHRFVGLANYRALAAHGEIVAVALRTLAYSSLVVAGTVALGLALVPSRTTPAPPPVQ